jgi:hypothetical protein
VILCLVGDIASGRAEDSDLVHKHSHVVRMFVNKIKQYHAAAGESGHSSKQTPDLESTAYVVSMRNGRGSDAGFLWEGRASARPQPVLVWDMVSGAVVAAGLANRIPLRSGEKVYPCEEIESGFK